MLGSSSALSCHQEEEKKISENVQNRCVKRRLQQGSNAISRCMLEISREEKVGGVLQSVLQYGVEAKTLQPHELLCSVPGAVHR